MPFRRRAFGRSRVHGTPRVPKAPKMAKPKRPKTSDLQAAYKKYLSGSRDARVQALYEAINWWDAAIKYFLFHKSMDAAALSTYEKANKARILGLDSGATPGECEAALTRCIKLYEKIWAAGNSVPEIDPFVQQLTAKQKELEAKEAAFQARYNQTLEALNTSFGDLGLSFVVQKSDIPRQFDGVKTVLLSQPLAKVLAEKAKSEGVLSVLFSEAPGALAASAVERDSEGRATFNVQKVVQSLPVLFKSILKFLDTVPRAKVFKAVPDSIEATVGSTVTKKQRAPRDPNAPKVQRAAGFGGRGSGPKVGGRYVPGSAMAILYERLQDEKPHPLSEILAGLAVGNPADRLKWLVKHGPETGRWTVTVSGNTVQMKLHK